MHTTEILAKALEEADLTEMSNKARQGYYHDFLSPLTFPEMQLMRDLEDAMVLEKDPDKYAAISALRTRHLNGEFDANLEESDEWAQSPEGQETFNMLIKGK